ncbi:MAG: hypothetical protein JXB39_04740 [Deltaproteobacteria bacterium]|nr:hypothetical protein [Deltaproteobacteria bacterium]
MASPRLLAALLVPLAAGCATRDLSESWILDRLRVLAVRPEPAEPRPGDTLALSALVVGPGQDLQAVLWLACQDDALGVQGCELDPKVLASLEGLETATPEEIAALYASLVEAGLIGVEPWIPPTYTVPPDILDGLDPAARLEGLNLWIQVTAIPEDASSDADLELAFKRVPVSEAQTPNHNPNISGLQVDGIEVPPGAVLELDRGQPYSFVPVLEKGSVESYRYLNQDGVWEDRTEEPWFLWYVEEGDLTTPWSLWPHPVQEWTPPATPSFDHQTLWVVVADRRGGMGWWTQPVHIR